MFRPQVAWILVLGHGLCAQAAESAWPPPRAQAFVQKYCGACHSGDEPEADLNLVRLFGRKAGKADIQDLLDIRDAVQAGDMPPEDEPSPGAAERAAFVAFVARALRQQGGDPDPGRVTMRRLSRYEYRQTVRDLCGIETDLTAGFPADDLGYGFDNNGDSLAVSTLHLEKYAEAAGHIARLAIRADDPRIPKTRRVAAADIAPADSRRIRARGDEAAVISRATLRWEPQLPRPGKYRLRIQAYGQQAGPEPVRIGVSLDGRERRRFDVKATRDEPGWYQLDINARREVVSLGISYLNDYYNKKAKDRSQRDRNLYVVQLRLEGPLDEAKPTPFQRQLMARDPGGPDHALRARKVLGPLVEAAWRRPVRRAELSRLSRLVATRRAAGESFELALRSALQVILTSPHFLFRIEAERRSSEDRAVEALDGHALATRLSYFLWSSMPDEKLRQLADRGALNDPAELRRQVDRMLADGKSRRLGQNFAAQWLELRRLDEVVPDNRRFKSYTRTLKQAMRAESEMLFDHVLRQGLPIERLLDARFTFLNEVLARHYGIKGVRGKKMRKIDLADSIRGGILSHAAILTVTSNPTRTSPVQRGKWILEQILDDPPPDPPPGADSFEDNKADLTKAATMREQLARHRRSKTCATCHNRMDGLGLALERFDPIGRYRKEQGGQAIDVRGVLPGGRKIEGLADLRRILVEGPAFRICMAKKMFLFALGRELRGSDALILDEKVRALPIDAKISDLIHLIVGLEAFRMRSRP